MSISTTESRQSVRMLDEMAKRDDRIQQAQTLADEVAFDVCHAIRSIPQALFSPAVLSIIAANLAAKVKDGNWSHFDYADSAICALDDLSTDLENQQ